MLTNYVIPPTKENIEILKSFILRNEVVNAENALREILDLLFVDRVCMIRFSTESVYDDEGGYNTYVADIEFLNKEGEECRRFGSDLYMSKVRPHFEKTLDPRYTRFFFERMDKDFHADNASDDIKEFTLSEWWEDKSYWVEILDTLGDIDSLLGKCCETEGLPIGYDICIEIPKKIQSPPNLNLGLLTLFEVVG